MSKRLYAGTQRNMKHPFLILLVAMVFTSIVQLFAQLPPYTEQWRWKHFSTDDGLPSNKIIDIQESSDGASWALTDRGLAYYNNFYWTTIDSSLGLPEQRVEFFSVSPSGKVAAVTSKELIYLGSQLGFQQVSLRMNNMVVHPKAMAYYSPNQFLIIHQDYKLYLWDSTLTHCTPFPMSTFDGQILKIWNTHTNNVWILSLHGLYCIEQDRPVLKIHSSNFPLSVSDITEDKISGGMAMVVYPPSYFGLWKWEPGKPPSLSAEGKQQNILSLDLRDNCNPIYTYNYGDTRTQIGSSWMSILPLPKEFINIILFRYRKNGDLWVSTESGLHLFRSTLKLWTYYRFPSTSKSNITGALLLTHAGELWVGSDSGVIIHKPNGETKFIESAAGQKLLGITGLAEDSDGKIWISSGKSFEGAYCLDGNRWTIYGPEQGLPSLIHRIVKDRIGRLWFLGIGKYYDDKHEEPGAFLYDEGKFVRWGTNVGLPSGRVYSFAEGTDGSYWFGTNGGLSHYHKGTWKHWNTSNGLLSSRIFSLAVDSENTVWFSHQYQGLASLRDGTIRYYTTANGLAGNNVWEISVDSLNRVWASTSNGLTCFDHGVWSQFDENIGLSPVRLWPIIPGANTVYIGTLGGGVGILNLTELKTPPPVVVFTSHSVEKNSAFFRWTPYSFLGELPSRVIESRYKIDNDPWSQWSEERIKFYFELSPGTHRFSVQAKNSLGTFAATGYSTTITIELPYYLQGRFLIPVGLLTSGIILLGTFILMRKRKHTNELKLSEERYRGIVRDQTEMICRFTPDGTITFVNDAFSRIFGRSMNELLGMQVSELLPQEQQQNVVERINKLLLLTPSNPVSIMTEEIFLPTGELRWQEWHSRAFFDEAGNVIEIQSVGRDVSEQKVMEAAVRQSEQDYRGLFENAHDAIMIFDPLTEEVLEINDRACEMYGYDRDEFIGMSLEKITEDVSKGKERIHDTLAKQFTFQFETIQRKKDGSKMFLEINASALMYQGHEAILSINRDITNKKVAEQAIAGREAILESLSFAGQQFVEQGSINDKIEAVVARLGLATNVSRSYLFENHIDQQGNLVTSQKYEWVAAKEYSQKENPDLHNFSYETSGFQRWRRALEMGIPVYGHIADFPEPERTILGKQKIFSIIVMPIVVHKKWWGHIGFDDCHKKHTWSSAEIDALSTAANIIGAVIEREERVKTVNMLAQAIKSISECVSITDLTNTILFVNDAFCSTYQYDRSDLIGKSIDVVLSETIQNPVPTILPATIKGGWQGELINRKKDGTDFPIFLSTSPVKDETDQPIALIGVATDITERKNVEQQLREQASLLNITTDAIIVEDMEHRVIYWNRGAEHLYGWEANEVIGQQIHALLSEEENEHSGQRWESLLTYGEWRGEVKQNSKVGRTLTVDSRVILVRDNNSLPVSILIVNTDITEKKVLEAQFLRSQRLESIGTLAGGIAHDLNNVLAPILLAIEVLKYRFPDSQSAAVLSTLETSAMRGREIIKQVLTFARGVIGERIVLQPKHIIKEMELIIKETFPKSLQISVSCVPELWTISGDPTQIHQVIMNICLNARDAMPKGGLLSIIADNIIIDEMFARTHLNAKPGAYVSICITDNGTGIPAEHLDKIFDPFFTTKEVGKGTGLGLSTVHAIMKGHNGFIICSSAMGKGSSFTLYFPVAQTAESLANPEAMRHTAKGKGELILVVDDEQAILDIARQTLEHAGYNIITATDGTEAISLYVQQGEKIDLVITDILMPFMDGLSLIRSLRQIQPAIKIIAASGQETDAQFLSAAGVSVQSFLPKPFNTESLLAAIQNALLTTAKSE